MVTSDLSAAGVVRSQAVSRARDQALRDQMFFIPAYPFWALTIIAMDVVGRYGLCAYGSRANVQAA